jgi:hypothetical protein
VRVQAAPLPHPEFEIVRDVTPKGSLSEADWSDPARTDVERFADIAKLAGVGSVIGGSDPTAINVAGKIPGGTLKPGLNYSSQLRSKFPDAPGGETGYLDSNDVYHNPTMPTELDGPLPRIVIILGPNAFRHGKASALATLRHEMAHAAHDQLALRWLAKWRTERPKASFKDWLAEQVKGKKLSPLEAAVMESSTGSGTTGTEVLAHTEGLVTTLPFIPPLDVALVESDQKYPAFVRAVRGAGQQFGRWAGNKDVTQAALDRIRTVCCGSLTQTQRDRLVEWIDLLLDPSSKPMPDSARKLLVAVYGPLADFLRKVREIAVKPCAAKAKP